MAGIPPKSWQPANVTLETTRHDTFAKQRNKSNTEVLLKPNPVIWNRGRSMGTLVVELYWRHAPNTCRNFAELARRGYYNGIKFHRIIKDFMIQGGDPTGTGRGGASIYGRQFDDEINIELKHTGAGILSMANSAPNSNGSQFFITLAPTQWLDGKHTIFGRIGSGMNVVQRIGMVSTDNGDKPTEDIKIIKGSIAIA